MKPGRYEIEFWAKTTGDTVHLAVKTDTRNWVAVLFKDFAEHGMIGEFGDAKLLTSEGVRDAYIADRPGGPPTSKKGAHT